MSTEADGRSGRLLLGIRFSRLAIEGSAGRFGMVVNDSQAFNSTMLGAGLKYSHPLGDNFEAFARGGLQRSYVTSDMGESSYDASGDGYYLGGGIEYRLNLLVAGGSIFLDYQYAKADLGSDAVQEFEASNRMWTIGLTLSL